MPNSTIGIIAGICSVGASFIAPTLYVGGIKEVNAVQDVKISSIELTQTYMKLDIKELSNKIDALLIVNGINPNKLK